MPAGALPAGTPPDGAATPEVMAELSGQEVVVEAAEVSRVEQVVVMIALEVVTTFGLVL